MDELRTLWPNNMLLVDTLYFLIVLMYETYIIHAKVLDLKINQEFRESRSGRELTIASAIPFQVQ